MGNVYYPDYLTCCQVQVLYSKYALLHIFYMLLRIKVLKKNICSCEGKARANVCSLLNLTKLIHNLTHQNKSYPQSYAQPAYSSQAMALRHSIACLSCSRCTPINTNASYKVLTFDINNVYIIINIIYHHAIKSRYKRMSLTGLYSAIRHKITS